MYLYEEDEALVRSNTLALTSQPPIRLMEHGRADRRPVITYL